MGVLLGHLRAAATYLEKQCQKDSYLAWKYLSRIWEYLFCSFIIILLYLVICPYSPEIIVICPYSSEIT